MNSVILTVKMPESPSIAKAAFDLLEVHCKSLGWEAESNTSRWECLYVNLSKISFDTLIIGGCQQITIAPKD